MKRPAFQFYPGDWRKDVELRACSLAARGLWIDLLCVAHECEPYGHLVLNGKPMTLAQIAGQIGVPAPQVKKLLDELIDNGVARRADDGSVYSKRMVDDERVRNARAEGGKAGSAHGIKGAEHGTKGGRPAKPKGVAKGGSETPLTGREEPPPSSSSSSSSSTAEEYGEEPTPTASREATARGAVGQALKRAGVDLSKLNLSDPRLTKLLEQGATPEEFEGIAREAVEQHIAQPVGWICTVLASRRAKAAEMHLAPAVPAASPAHRRAEALTAGNVAVAQRYLARKAQA